MSAEVLHNIATNDTPSSVTVPKDMNGLMLWAVGRFGGGAVIGILCLIGIKTTYQDLQDTNRQLMAVLQENAKTNAQFVQALESIKGEIHDAHNRAYTSK